MQKALTIMAFILIVTVIFFGINMEPSDTPSDKVITIENLEEIKPVPPVDFYGFQKDLFTYEEARVQRNESLYLILRRHGLSPRQIYNIQQESRDKVNLNRMMPGQYYRIYYYEDEPVSFIWRQSATQYVSLGWQDDLVVENASVPIRKKMREATGVIHNSLYQSILSNGYSRYLGSELAEIFAWEIDFFALRQGDHYKVYYEELYAGDELIGIGDIKAAEFQHRGQVYRAYHFENDQRRGYFDADGNSLEKELLKAPFRYNQRVSSGFSANRFHPILQRNRPHYGTDYAAPEGTPVLAVGDGVVTEAQRRGGNGNIVQIRHNASYRTAYLHLSGFAPGIRRGAKVEQGQVIGYVGQTGLATGPHLCYRLYINDRPVNSVTADLPASESLEEEFMEEFRVIIHRMDDILNQLELVEQIASN